MLQQSFEQEARAKGFEAVCGVDEAGRGPLAGPVVAAAVILPSDFMVEELNDSKKLSEKKREVLFDLIQDKAIAYAIAMVDHQRIDQVNILQATFQAMREAVEQVAADYVLIDGNQIPQLKIPACAIVGGDGKSPSIAAASILAKVARDRYMCEMEQQYPGYGFAKHKGYGTKMHYAAIQQLGACPIHRKTFLRKFYAKQS